MIRVLRLALSRQFRVLLNWTGLISALSLLTLTSCGQSESANGSLALALKPGSAILSPNGARNCSDIVESSEDPSITSPSITFANFVLQWNSADDFYVAAIRVKVTGAGVSGGEQVFFIDSDDAELVLGRPSGYIKGSATKQTIQSMDPSRKLSQYPDSTTLPACPLAFGPVTLTNGTSTASFTATIEVDVIGTSIDANGDQSFVRASTTATAEHISY